MDQYTTWEDRLADAEAEIARRRASGEGVDTIAASRDLRISNLDALPRGTGAKLLRCIRDHKGGLIAKAWARKATSRQDGEVLVVFGPMIKCGPKYGHG